MECPYNKILVSEDGKTFCTIDGEDISEEEYEEALRDLENNYVQCTCGEYNDIDAKECWDCGQRLDEDEEE